MAKAATIATLGTITVYLFSKPITKYGLSGCIRYIWEGDHLPPHIREAFNELDKVEFKQLKKENQKLSVIVDGVKKVFLPFSQFLYICT